MNETQAVAVFLLQIFQAHAALTALVGTQIYEGLAPEGSQPPYLLYSLNAASDLNAVGRASRVDSRQLWLVKGITTGNSAASAAAIASAADDALEDATDTITLDGRSYRVTVIGRTAAIRLPPSGEGIRYHHIGGLYRIFVGPAS